MTLTEGGATDDELPGGGQGRGISGRWIGGGQVADRWGWAAATTRPVPHILLWCDQTL